MPKLGVVTEAEARALDASFVDWVKGGKHTGLEPYYLTETVTNLRKGVLVLAFTSEPKSAINTFMVLKVTGVQHQYDCAIVRVANDNCSWRTDGLGVVLSNTKGKSK